MTKSQSIQMPWKQDYFEVNVARKKCKTVYKCKEQIQDVIQTEDKLMAVKSYTKK